MLRRLLGRMKRSPRGEDSPHARLVAVHQAYWTPSKSELRRLCAVPPSELSWPACLRLLHLTCMAVLDTGDGRKALQGDHFLLPDPARDPFRTFAHWPVLIERLTSEVSPYRPRASEVWHSSPLLSPDIRGVLHNASLTHLGALEVIWAELDGTPREVGFVSFDELHSLSITQPGTFCTARVAFDDGRDEALVWLPLLYGVSYRTGRRHDLDGSTTRFICHTRVPGHASRLGIGIGVGQQDFQTGGTLCGLASVRKLATTLDVHDPRFDERCRARGLDPDQVLTEMVESPS
jgi:hypothetical protein